MSDDDRNYAMMLLFLVYNLLTRSGHAVKVSKFRSDLLPLGVDSTTIDQNSNK